MTRRPLTALIFIGITALAAFAVPKPKYQSPDVLSKLSIPTEFGYWKSRDVSSQLNVRDKRFAFLSRVFARQYVNDLGESLLFLIVDAGNFHHPKVCFGSSGFQVTPQEDLEIQTAGRTLRAKVLFMEKGADDVLVVYWMCLDGKLIDWNEQKAKEFVYSVLGKPRVGLMGRLDIPTNAANKEGAKQTAKAFLKSLGQEIKPDDTGKLFGEAVRSKNVAVNVKRHFGDRVPFVLG